MEEWEKGKINRRGKRQRSDVNTKRVSDTRARKTKQGEGNGGKWATEKLKMRAKRMMEGKAWEKERAENRTASQVKITKPRTTNENDKQ